jgi:hypothetical protein
MEGVLDQDIMIFIKLTTTSDKLIWFNISDISVFTPGKEGSEVYNTSGDCYYVRESVSQILSLLEKAGGKKLL